MTRRHLIAGAAGAALSPLASGQMEGMDIAMSMVSRLPKAA